MGQLPKPVVTVPTVNPQTSCDASQPNGAAIASASGGSGSYDFEWFRGQNTQPANRIGTQASVQSLGVGRYTVKVTDQASGCFATQQISITANVSTPTLSASVVDETQCAPPNGSITATVSSGNVSDYVFSWYNGNRVKATPDYTNTTAVLTGLAAGVYTVKARSTITLCETPARTFTVGKGAPLISIAINTSLLIPPGACNSPTGTLAVDVTAPGNTAGFRVDWYTGGAPLTAAPYFTETVAQTSTTPNTLSSGGFTVVATDLNTGCSAEKELTLPFSNAHNIALVSKTDITTCVPNNNAGITVMLTPGTPASLFNEGDYDIFVYTGKTDPGAAGAALFPAISGIAGVSNYATPSTLTAGFYTFVAVAKSTTSIAGCRSTPLVVEIVESTTDPVVTPTTMSSNTSCNVAMNNGQLTVSTPNASSFDWYNGTTVKPAADFNGATYSNLAPGFYTVRATDLSTGCFSTETYFVLDEPIDVVITPSGFSADNVVLCDPGTGNPIPNGTAQVSTIEENGGAGNLANYNFIWADAAGNTLQSGTSASIVGLAAGDYVVTATNTASACFTQYQFNIEDIRPQLPEIDLVSFDIPTRCVTAQQGRLEVIGTSSLAGSFTYEWYVGTTAFGTIVSNSNNFQNITIPTAQTSITHTVKVINTPSNCWATETYELPLLVNPVIVSASSSSPITSCATANGTVFATVINDNSLDYDYRWYIGNSVLAVPDFLGKTVNDLPAGSYTVQAVDLIDGFCLSAPLTVLLEDQRIEPVVTAALTSPVTNCDPSKLNGSASASVNGSITNHIFDWFAGSTIGPTPVFTGPAATGLAEGVYTVRATDRVTGCFGTAQVTINQSLEAVPLPEVEILSQVTSCTEPNGALRASVDGNTEDYIFFWYTGANVKNNPDYEGEIYEELAAGTYTVTATSRITGCVSAPVSEALVEDQVNPDFDFRVEPATCGDANGSTSIFLTVNVQIESIEWEANSGSANGPNLSNINPGTYTVTVVSQLGCAATKSVTINSDIRPYNGVSRNGDGRNDIFYINCIDQFPNNNVKIYNRAGTMVYEGDNYNNVDIFFDGKSNRGVSPMGTELPDGTYFYLIDKRDGSKPIAGYLELVN